VIRFAASCFMVRLTPFRGGATASNLVLALSDSAPGGAASVCSSYAEGDSQSPAAKSQDPQNPVRPDRDVVPLPQFNLCLVKGVSAEASTYPIHAQPEWKWDSKAVSVLAALALSVILVGIDAWPATHTPPPSEPAHANYWASATSLHGRPAGSRVSSAADSEIPAYAATWSTAAFSNASPDPNMTAGDHPADGNSSSTAWPLPGRGS